MHDLSCRWSEGRHPRHSALNDIIHRSLSSAHISDTLAHSHVSSAAMSSGTVSKSRQNRPRGLSMPIWMQATTLYQWQWRHQECWAQRLSLSSVTLDTAPRRQLGSKGPFSFSSNVCRWLCSGGMQWRFWDFSEDPLI